MNKLSIAKRCQITELLLAGSSLIEAAKNADVSINTAIRLLRNLGSACHSFHNSFVQEEDLHDTVVIATRSFSLKGNDIYTWITSGASSNLITSWTVGALPSNNGSVIPVNEWMFSSKAVSSTSRPPVPRKIHDYMQAIALQVVYHNFGRIQKKIDLTPAMKVGLAIRPMNIEDIVELSNPTTFKSTLVFQ